MFSKTSTVLGNFEVPIFCFGKYGGPVSQNTYLEVVAVLVSGKEAYGGQKQALNISSLTLETMQI